MKQSWVFLCGLFVLCLPAQGQGLVLNAGDTFVYEFNSLPLFSHIPDVFPGPFGNLAFDVSTTSWQTGTRLHYEMFETSISETPIFSGVLDEPPPSSFGNRINATVFGSWQDNQGAIRFYAEGGSATVEDITLMIFMFGGVGLDRYEANVPVPEPSTVVLVLMGAGLLLAGRRYCSRHLC